jgi:hypothetical protein
MGFADASASVAALADYVRGAPVALSFCPDLEPFVSAELRHS